MNRKIGRDMGSGHNEFYSRKHNGKRYYKKINILLDSRERPQFKQMFGVDEIAIPIPEPID